LRKTRIRLLRELNSALGLFLITIKGSGALFSLAKEVSRVFILSLVHHAEKSRRVAATAEKLFRLSSCRLKRLPCPKLSRSQCDEVHKRKSCFVTWAPLLSSRAILIRDEDFHFEPITATIILAVLECFYNNASIFLIYSHPH
jgi:hypothetical protein